MSTISELNGTQVTLSNGESYVFNSDFLTMGIFEEVNCMVNVDGMIIGEDNKPLVTDYTSLTQGSLKLKYEKRKKLAQICFNLPENFDFDGLSIVDGKALLSVIDKADFFEEVQTAM
jgi:hypothetical protein